MPTWPELHDFETQFDTALATILAPFAAAPYSLTLYGQQSVAELVAPRLEYQFALGALAGPGDSPQLRASATLAARPLVFSFTFLFRHVFDRTVTTAAQQAALRGALRELLAPPAPGAEGAFSAANLPWLTIIALQEQRAIRGLVRDDERDKQLDAWESAWEGLFTIRTTALPD